MEFDVRSCKFAAKYETIGLIVSSTLNIPFIATAITPSNVPSLLPALPIIASSPYQPVCQINSNRLTKLGLSFPILCLILNLLCLLP